MMLDNSALRSRETSSIEDATGMPLRQPRPVRPRVADEPMPPRTQSLAERMESRDTVGVRELSLLALQLATELRMAQVSRVALAPLTPHSVTLIRVGTPFEQATLRPAPSRGWRSAQEREGLEALGSLLLDLLNKPLVLESSLATAGERSSHLPPRRADLPLLVGLHRALSSVARKCQPDGPRSYASAAFAITDLSRVLGLVGRSIATRQAAPVRTLHTPRAARPPRTPQPKVFVNDAASLAFDAGAEPPENSTAALAA